MSQVRAEFEPVDFTLTIHDRTIAYAAARQRLLVDSKLSLIVYTDRRANVWADLAKTR